MSQFETSQAGNKKSFIAILMGSDSDLPIMQHTIDTFIANEIPFEVKITSAHRTPEQTKSYVGDAEKRGVGAFICAAGLAAHLAGAVAAYTIKPVIGVPLSAGVLDGWDALLSTVQMPGGVPVATVAVGKAGAKNAAILAMQMLALSCDVVAAKLVQMKEAQKQQVIDKDRLVSEKYAQYN
jgi:5-(carboxyamino)imidazole ribonucleotide mutase